MNISMIEFMMRDVIPIDSIRKFLSDFFHMPSDNVVTENEFWDIPLENLSRNMSIDIRYTLNGFKTLVVCNVFVNPDFQFFEKLAKELIAQYQSDVVVPDCRDKFEGPDRIIIYFKDGKCAEGINMFLNGYNDIEITAYI